MAEVEYTFTHKQYIERYKTKNTENNTTILEECGPCPILASYTLAFALQPRKKHGKTSVRVAATKNTYKIYIIYIHIYIYNMLYMMESVIHRNASVFWCLISPPSNLTSFILHGALSHWLGRAFSLSRLHDHTQKHPRSVGLL